MGPPLKAGTPITGPERPQSRLVAANYTMSCVQAPQGQTSSSFGGQPGRRLVACLPPGGSAEDAVAKASDELLHLSAAHFGGSALERRLAFEKLVAVP